MNKLLNTPYYGKWTKSCQLAEDLSSEFIHFAGDGDGDGEGNRKFPSVRQIAKKYQVSCCTAAKALKILAEKGLLKQVQGKGSFIQKSEKKLVKVGLLYDPDIYEKEEYFCCLQRKVCDYLYKQAEKNDFSIFPINIFSGKEELKKSLSSCDILVQNIHKKQSVECVVTPETARCILYGTDKYIDPEDMYQVIYVSVNMEKGFELFFTKHDPGSYERIVFIYHHSRVVPLEIIKKQLAKRQFPMENVVEIQLPVSNFTAKEVTERFMEKKKETFAGQKILLISLSGYFREGLFNAFTPEERPDILQLEGEHPAPKNFSVKGKGFFGCLNSKYEHIAAGVLQAIKMCMNKEVYCCGSLFTEMEYREFIPKKEAIAKENTNKKVLLKGKGRKYEKKK